MERPVIIPIHPTAPIVELPAIAERVDFETLDRLAAWAREHLASLTPERRAELERDA